MQSVGNWLRRLGLAQYAQRFAENDIDLIILSDLTDRDLKEIGVSSLGHRRLLLQAIAELKAAETGSTNVATPAAPLAPRRHPAAERRQATAMFSGVVGSGEAQERDIVDNRPHPARLRAPAGPKTVVVTGALAGNFFGLEELGRWNPGGIAGPVGAWGALRPGSAASRSDALLPINPAAYNPLSREPGAGRGSTKCVSTTPPKILRRTKSSLPDACQLDAEQLRIDGALAHVQDRGNLDDYPGDASERRALMITAVRRGLVSWDRAAQHYRLAGAGKGQLAGWSLKATSAAAAARVPGSEASAEDRFSRVDRAELHQPVDRRRWHPAASFAAIVALAACSAIGAGAYLGPLGMLTVGSTKSVVSPDSPPAASAPSSAPAASIPPVGSGAPETSAAAQRPGTATTATATGSVESGPPMAHETSPKASLGNTLAAAIQQSQHMESFGAPDVQLRTSYQVSPLQPYPMKADERLQTPAVSQTLDLAAPSQKPKLSRHHHHGNRYGRYKGSRFATENHQNDPRENWSWGSRVGYGY